MKDVNPFCVQSHCMGGGAGTRHKIVCSSTQNRSQQNEKSFSAERFFVWRTKFGRFPRRMGRPADGSIFQKGCVSTGMLNESWPLLYPPLRDKCLVSSNLIRIFIRDMVMCIYFYRISVKQYGSNIPATIYHLYYPVVFFGANHFQFDFLVGGTKQPYAVAEKNRYDSQMISVYHIT